LPLIPCIAGCGLGFVGDLSALLKLAHVTFSAATLTANATLAPLFPASRALLN
jgi:hypothetical protein